ncbi:MAG: hypothetical protein ACYC56_04290 [Candidatus Aquicultor sp.]
MAITETTYKEKLEKFLPPFIAQSAIRDALLTAIARRLLELQQAIAALPNANWTGKGLILNAAENKIFGNNRRLCLTSPAGEFLLLPDGLTQLTIRKEDLAIDTLLAVGLPDNQTVLLLPDGLTYLSISETYSEEPPVQNRLEERFQFWSERGTGKGIKHDLESMFGLDFSTLILHDSDSGIIGDVTEFDDLQFVGCDKLIEFHTSDRGYIVHRTEDDAIIKKHIIPIDAEIIFIGE